VSAKKIECQPAPTSDDDLRRREEQRAKALGNQWMVTIWNKGRRTPRRPSLIELKNEI
jgi:hypothetical protein